MCGCNKQRAIKMQPNHASVSPSQMMRRTVVSTNPNTTQTPNQVLESQNPTSMNNETLRKEKLRREAIRRSLGR